MWYAWIGCFTTLLAAWSTAHIRGNEVQQGYRAVQEAYEASCGEQAEVGVELSDILGHFEAHRGDVKFEALPAAEVVRG